MIKINTLVIDNGLSLISGNTVKMTICQTEPTTLADCTSLSGSGGKRVCGEKTVTIGEIALTDGANAVSRKLVFPYFQLSNSIAVNVAINVADLWIAVYSGTDLLLVSDGLNPAELVIGYTIAIPSFEFGSTQIRI